MESTLTVYGTKRAWGQPSGSPFCTKLEAFLRMVNIPYELAEFDPMKAPRGKMPYIRYKGQLIPDSEEIIELLTEDFDVKLDDHLNPHQHALGHAIKRMLEEGTYFVAYCDRWMDDDNWQVVRSTFFNDMLPVLRNVVPELIRRNVRRTLKGHGISRFPREKMRAAIERDFSATVELLGDSKYLFGDKPTTYDCTVFAFALAVAAPMPHALVTEFDPKLVAYRDRFLEQYFPELVADFKESAG